MSIRFKIVTNVQVSQMSAAFTDITTIESDWGPTFSKTIEGAKSGTLTTRTDDTTGVLTMAAGHGIATNDVIDIYWDGGSRRNVTVGTVSGDLVPISNGAGDNLPAVNAAITAMVVVSENLVLVGNDLKAMVFELPVRGTIALFDGTGELFSWVNTETTKQIYLWHEQNGVTNPIAGDTTTLLKVSHASTSSQLVRAAFLRD